MLTFKEQYDKAHLEGLKEYFSELRHRKDFLENIAPILQSYIDETICLRDYNQANLLREKLKNLRQSLTGKVEKHESLTNSNGKVRKQSFRIMKFVDPRTFSAKKLNSTPFSPIENIEKIGSAAWEFFELLEANSYDQDSIQVFIDRYHYYALQRLHDPLSHSTLFDEALLRFSELQKQIKDFNKSVKHDENLEKVKRNPFKYFVDEKGFEESIDEIKGHALNAGIVLAAQNDKPSSTSFLNSEAKFNLSDKTFLNKKPINTDQYTSTKDYNLPSFENLHYSLEKINLSMAMVAENVSQLMCHGGLKIDEEFIEHSFHEFIKFEGYKRKITQGLTHDHYDIFNEMIESTSSASLEEEFFYGLLAEIEKKHRFEIVLSKIKPDTGNLKNFKIQKGYICYEKGDGELLLYYIDKENLKENNFEPLSLNVYSSDIRVYLHPSYEPRVLLLSELSYLEAIDMNKQIQHTKDLNYDFKTSVKDFLKKHYDLHELNNSLLIKWKNLIKLEQGIELLKKQNEEFQILFEENDRVMNKAADKQIEYQQKLEKLKLLFERINNNNDILKYIQCVEALDVEIVQVKNKLEYDICSIQELIGDKKRYIYPHFDLSQDFGVEKALKNANTKMRDIVPKAKALNLKIQEHNKAVSTLNEIKREYSSLKEKFNFLKNFISKDEVERDELIKNIKNLEKENIISERKFSNNLGKSITTSLRNEQEKVLNLKEQSKELIQNSVGLINSAIESCLIKRIKFLDNQLESVEKIINTFSLNRNEEVQKQLFEIRDFLTDHQDNIRFLNTQSAKSSIEIEAKIGSLKVLEESLQKYLERKADQFSDKNFCNSKFRIFYDDKRRVLKKWLINLFSTYSDDKYGSRRIKTCNFINVVKTHIEDFKIPDLCEAKYHTIPDVSSQIFQYMVSSSSRPI